MFSDLVKVTKNKTRMSFYYLLLKIIIKREAVKCLDKLKLDFFAVTHSSQILGVNTIKICHSHIIHHRSGLSIADLCFE